MVDRFRHLPVLIMLTASLFVGAAAFADDTNDDRGPGSESGFSPTPTPEPSAEATPAESSDGTAQDSAAEEDGKKGPNMEGLPRYNLGVRLGYTSWVKDIFEDSNVDMSKNNTPTFGLEFEYRIVDRVYASFSAEYYKAPSDAPLELEFVPLSVGIRSVFNTKHVRPYLGGSANLVWFSHDSGRVAKAERVWRATTKKDENGNVVVDKAWREYEWPDSEPDDEKPLFSITDGELLSEQGDKQFRRALAFGVQMQFGMEFEVHSRVTLYLEGTFRAYATTSKFNTYSYPVFAGVRVGL